MSIRPLNGLKALVVCVALTLVSACGGGGGGGEPTPVLVPAPAPVTAPPAANLALMFDSLGRQVPEADFGRGDREAAGADGIAFDNGPMAHAQVTLADSLGARRTATTDASGYYRIDTKYLQPPFILSVKRNDGSEWHSVSVNSASARRFVPVNINGLTDKTLGFAADALGVGGGAASAVTPALLRPNQQLLAAAKARLLAGLAAPIGAAGLDFDRYDPAITALDPSTAAKNAALLRRLTITKNGQGRTVVVGTVAGTAATFSRPNSVALDSAGNVYVADFGNAVIRKITPDGVTTTLAGTGTPGFSDGPGATATFRFPAGIAVDAGGNVFVADSHNYAIRKITPAGFVTTLAGGGTGPEFADGVGTAARFSSPQDLAVDGAGNVYVPDTTNDAIRKISATGVVTTISASKFSGSTVPLPKGARFFSAVAVDAAGHLYVGVSEIGAGGGGAVRKMAPDGVVSTVYAAGDGGWFTARGITVGADGVVYVTMDRRVYRIASGIATPLAGDTGLHYEAGFADGTGTAAMFAELKGIAIDSGGSLFVADVGNNAIRKVTQAGAVSTFAGRRIGYAQGFGTAALFDGPTGVAVDASGTIFVADTGNHAIRRIARNGQVTTLAGNGTGGYVTGFIGTARFRLPTGVAIDGGGTVHVADTGNQAIRKITPNGSVVTIAGSLDPSVSTAYWFIDGQGLSARFHAPSSIALGPDGTLYISDFSNESIRKITPDAAVTTLAGSGPAHLLTEAQLLAQGFGMVGRAVAVDQQGVVYFPAKVPQKKSQFQRIFSIAPDGTLRARTQPYEDFRQAGLAVDRQGTIYYGRDRSIFKVTAAGVETEVVGGGIAYVESSRFAVDGNGNLIVSDTANSAIRVVLP